ncbi:MAG: hypothetical protein OXE76_10425 [Alphaproteobacteria bacterium]|nr:hypothetical protein [Alphaproteobacteria bacterium]
MNPLRVERASSTVTTRRLLKQAFSSLPILVAGIEHAATLALLDADGSREGAVGQLLLAQGLVESCGQNGARNRRLLAGRWWMCW